MVARLLLYKKKINCRYKQKAYELFQNYNSDSDCQNFNINLMNLEKALFTIYIIPTPKENKSQINKI